MALSRDWSLWMGSVIVIICLSAPLGLAESEVTAAASASPDNLQSGAEEIWRGELVIDGTHPVPANRTKVLRPGTLFKLFGNLTVKNGGRMWVNASSLVIFQSQLSPYRIAVAGTGSLLSFEGSHLTVGDAIFPRYWLDVSVTNGGRLSVADSRFSFPGLISVAGSTLQFNGSSARSAPNAVANGTVQERYGPMLDLNGSRIVSVVSSFHDYPELGSEEMKLRGASEWVAVDTHLDIDLRNQTDPAHNILNVSGTAVLYALGLTFDLAETGSRPLGPAILTSGNFSSAYLFRWSSLQIDDSYSTPMPNATLGFEPETPFPLNSTTRALNDLSLPHPYSTAFLTRLSELHHPRDGTNYRLTDPQGRAVVPLLSDILNHTTMPNPIFAGIYNSSIDHPIGIAAGYPLTLEHYPRCTPKDNWSNRTFTHPGSLTHADLRPVINASKEVTIVTPLNISIRLLNEGDADAKDFEVLLFDDLTNDSALDPKEWIATWTGVDVPAKGEVILQVTHTFTRLPREAHRLVAIADPNSTVKNEPLAFRDDNLARSFVMLRDLPDLLPYEIGTTDESGKRTGILLNGSVATVSFRLENIGDSTSTPTVAGIYDSDPGIGEKPGKNATASVPIGELTPGAGTAASEKIPFNLAGRGSVCVWLDKDLQLRELQEGNNRACATVDVVNVSDLRAEGARITGSVMPTGRVTFFTTVRNVGYWTMERIAVELRDNASGTILNRTSISSLAPNAHKEVGLSWSIPRNETPGIRPIALLVNADRNASPSGYPGHRESDMANNEAYIKADIARLTATLEMPWKDVKVQAGRDIILGGRVLATGSAYPLDNVTVLASFQGSSQIHSTVTETAGTFTLRVQVPQALGKQTFTVRMDGIEGSSVIGTVTVVEAPGAGLPLILGGVALASIAMALVGFLLFARVKAQTMAQCDECGQLVRLDTSRCPRCKTEFDLDKVRCSVCFAWIPASSTECANCEVRFTRTKSGPINEAQRLKRKYDEYVEKYRLKYRQSARTIYTEAGFRGWWRQQRSFLTRKQFVEMGGQVPPSMEASDRPAAGTESGPEEGAAVAIDAPPGAGAAAKPGKRKGRRPDREGATLPVKAPGTQDGGSAAPGTAVPASSPDQKPAPYPLASPEENRLLARAPNLPSAKKREIPPRRCLLCFSMNAMDADLCWSCGTPLEPLLRCQKCGEWAAPEVDYCPRCGNNISIG